MEYLEHILKNDNNKDIIQFTKSEIKNNLNTILTTLEFTKSEIKRYNKILNNYRYISNKDHIRYGCYIRWFNSNLKLVNGGIVCNIINDGDAYIIQVKNNKNRIFSCKTNKSVIFQKLTQQEELLLEITNMLSES